MPSSFADIRTVLDLTRLRLPRSPRPPFVERPSVHFLWPALVRQVLVRLRRRRRLNLFQEYVLRLAQAGFTDPPRIASLLMPAALGTAGAAAGPVQLVRRIQAELQMLRALDTNLRPTDMAVDILAGVVASDGDVSACYLFQDPWNGDTWERFPPSLLPFLIEISWDRRDAGLFGVLAPDAEGRPRQRGLVVQPAEQRSIHRPSPEQIVAKFDRYAAAWRVFMARHDEAEESSEDPDEDDAAAPGFIDEVISVGEPEAVLLQCVAYVPERGDGSLPWETADPFGLGVSRVLRGRIDELARSQALGGFPRWLTGQLAERQAELPADGETLTDKALFAVELALHGTPRPPRDLRDELVTMQRTAFALQERLAVGHRGEAADLVRLFFTTAGIALERLMRAVAAKFPTAGCYTHYGLVTGEPRRSARVLNEIAVRLGFATGASERLPDRFTHVDAKRIRRAADVGDTALNGLTWAMVLTADLDPTGRHPLRHAARSAPNLLLEIAEIGRLRDETSHAVVRPENHLDAVASLGKTVFMIVRLLLADSSEL